MVTGTNRPMRESSPKKSTTIPSSVRPIKRDWPSRDRFAGEDALFLAVPFAEDPNRLPFHPVVKPHPAFLLDGEELFKPFGLFGSRDRVVHPGGLGAGAGGKR